MLQEEEEEGDDEPGGREGEVKTGRDVDMGDDEREEGLHPQEIDAYWLQRRIARAFTDIDADAGQKLAEEVLDTLQVWPSPFVVWCQRQAVTCAAMEPLIRRTDKSRDGDWR